jgi:hypothetical protein
MQQRPLSVLRSVQNTERKASSKSNFSMLNLVVRRETARVLRVDLCYILKIRYILLRVCGLQHQDQHYGMILRPSQASEKINQYYKCLY